MVFDIIAKNAQKASFVDLVYVDLKIFDYP